MREKIRPISSLPVFDRAVSDRLQEQAAIIDGLLYAERSIAERPNRKNHFLAQPSAQAKAVGLPSTVLLCLARMISENPEPDVYDVRRPPATHFATSKQKIGNGLDEQPENFIKEHPDTKLKLSLTPCRRFEAGGEAQATMRSSQHAFASLPSMKTASRGRETSRHNRLPLCRRRNGQH